MALDYRAPPIETEYALLARTLPHGRAWNAKYDRTRVLGRLVRSFSEEIHRFFRAIEEFVLVELDPVKTHQLLLEWEKSVGIPDKCFGRAADEETRRLHVQKKLANFGDPVTREDIEGILAFFGEPIDIVSGREIYGEDLGFGTAPYTADEVKQIRHTALIRVGSTAESFPLEFPIVFGGSVNTIVECLVTRLLPANISIQFLFGEDLSQPYRGVSFQAIGTTITGGAGEIGSGVGFGAVGAIETGGTATMNRLREESTTGSIETGGIASIDVPLPLPTNFPNLEFWYELMDIGTLTAPSNIVELAQDLSANNRDIAQGTPGNRPNFGTIGGLPGVIFDGVDDFLANNAVTITGIEDFTWFVLFTPTSDASTGVDVFRLKDGIDNRISFRQNTAGTNSFFDALTGTDLNMGVSSWLVSLTPRWAICRLRDAGAGATCDILTSTGANNSNSSPTTTHPQLTRINVGANDNGLLAFPGGIHVFGGFSRFISDAERAGMVTYLNDRITP